MFCLKKEDNFTFKISRPSKDPGGVAKESMSHREWCVKKFSLQ